MIDRISTLSLQDRAISGNARTNPLAPTRARSFDAQENNSERSIPNRGRQETSQNNDTPDIARSARKENTRNVENTTKSNEEFESHLNSLSDDSSNDSNQHNIASETSESTGPASEITIPAHIYGLESHAPQNIGLELTSLPAQDNLALLNSGDLTIDLPYGLDSTIKLDQLPQNFDGLTQLPYNSTEILDSALNISNEIVLQTGTSTNPIQPILQIEEGHYITQIPVSTDQQVLLENGLTAPISETAELTGTLYSSIVDTELSSVEYTSDAELIHIAETVDIENFNDSNGHSIESFTSLSGDIDLDQFETGFSDLSPEIDTADLANIKLGALGSNSILDPQAGPTLNSVLSTEIAAISANITNTTRLSPQQNIVQLNPTNFPLPNEAVKDIAGQLVSSVQTEKGLSLRLNPPELGQLHIDFSFDGAQNVTATIRADAPDVLNQLRDQAQILQDALREQGFENINLNFSQENASQDAPQQGERIYANLDDGDTGALPVNNIRPITSYPTLDGLISRAQPLDIKL